MCAAARPSILDLGVTQRAADEPAWRIGRAAGWNQAAQSGSIVREQPGCLLIGEEADDELVDDVGLLHRHTVGSARDDGDLAVEERMLGAGEVRERHCAVVSSQHKGGCGHLGEVGDLQGGWLCPCAVQLVEDDRKVLGPIAMRTCAAARSAPPPRPGAARPAGPAIRPPARDQSRTGPAADPSPRHLAGRPGGARSAARSWPIPRR